MADAAKLLKQAEGLISRLERLLPQEAPPTDWKASIAFRWRKKNGTGYIEPVRHVHRIALRDLQGIDAQKELVEQKHAAVRRGPSRQQRAAHRCARHRQVLADQGVAQQVRVRGACG